MLQSNPVSFLINEIVSHFQFRSFFIQEQQRVLLLMHYISPCHQFVVVRVCTVTWSTKQVLGLTVSMVHPICDLKVFPSSIFQIFRSLNAGIIAIQNPFLYEQVSGDGQLGRLYCLGQLVFPLLQLVPIRMFYILPF